MIKFYCSCTYV